MAITHQISNVSETFYFKIADKYTNNMNYNNNVLPPDTITRHQETEQNKTDIFFKLIHTCTVLINTV